MGWISPTGHEDGAGWYEPEKAYDDDEATFSLSPMPLFNTYTSFLTLIHAELTCDAIQLLLGYQYGEGMLFDIDVYKDGAWVHVYDDYWIGKWDVWQTIRFVEGEVTKMRLRWKNIDPFTTARLKWFEADFWEVEAPPPAAGGVTALYLTFARPPA